MWANRDLPLPLVIIFLTLLRGYTSFSTPSVPRRTSTRPVNPRVAAPGESQPPDDYYELDETVSTVPLKTLSTDDQGSELCDYNVCREMQTPCAVLENATGCLCPGLTSYREPPKPPNTRKVSREGSEVVIRWCAPYSPVIAYKVTVGGQERQTFGEDRRSGIVGKIDYGAKVCVVAVNDVGVSRTSCIIYESTGDNVSLKAGLIGGALSFLLLLSLAVLLWRHRTRRKSEARIST